jgi:hypothetical protein
MDLDQYALSQETATAARLHSRLPEDLFLCSGRGDGQDSASASIVTASPVCIRYTL